MIAVVHFSPKLASNAFVDTQIHTLLPESKRIRDLSDSETVVSRDKDSRARDLRARNHVFGR